MRDSNVFAFSKALPRMSWSPRNLYNLWQRCFGGKITESQFERTAKTLFQQRWVSKRLVRAYHGDHINEKSFKKWYLPSTLPEVFPKKNTKHDDSIVLAKWARRQGVVDQLENAQRETSSDALAPVGSLMFAEVERRVDVFIFRCCFAHSVYEARRLVIHGNVKLNGVLHTNANTRLAPGDMVSVDPSAIRFLRYQEMITAEEGEIPKEKSEVVDTTSNNKDEWDLELRPRVAELHPGQPWRQDPRLSSFTLPDYAAPFIFIPAYIEPSFSTCSAVYVRHPTARPGYSEIPTPYNADGEVMRLAWEWYARRRPRIRSRRRIGQMPEDRQRMPSA